MPPTLPNPTLMAHKALKAHTSPRDPRLARLAGAGGGVATPTMTIGRWSEAIELFYAAIGTHFDLGKCAC